MSDVPFPITIKIAIALHNKNKCMTSCNHMYFTTGKSCQQRFFVTFIFFSLYNVQFALVQYLFYCRVIRCVISKYITLNFVLICVFS